MDNMDTEYKRKWTAEERRKLAAGEISGGFAGPEQSFPIGGPEDVSDAWGLAGHADNPDAVRRKVIAIARAHGWLDALPASAREWMRRNKSVDIKAITDDMVEVAGYGVVFGGVDLTGDTFTPETDFMPGLVPVKVVTYDHALQEVKHIIGQATAAPDEYGLWVEAQLNRHADYVEQVRELVEADALGWSSGSVGHLVMRDGGKIKRWPIVEFALTPTPAEPRTLGVRELRSLAIAMPDVKALIPEESEDPLPNTEGEGAGSGEATESEAKATVTVTDEHVEVDIMSDINIEEIAAQAATKAVEAVWAKLAAERPQATGEYATLDEAIESQEGTKNFGDFLLAVKRRDETYLAKAFKASTQVEGDGTLGGYLVPDQFRAELLQVMGETALVRPRATVIPAAGPKLSIPALHQTGGPTTAGDPIWFGGVTMAWTEEGGTKTQTDIDFKLVNLVVHELSGYLQASNALTRDSAKAGMSIASLITRLFGGAFAWTEDYVFLRGNGVAKPLGVLNSLCLKSVTRNTGSHIKYQDIYGMYAVFYGERGVWLVSRGDAVTDLLSMVDAGNNLIWQPNAAVGSPGTIMGMPVIITEKLPALGTAGDIMLADFSKYVIYDMGEFVIDFSEHFAFTSNKGTWRCAERLDGQPWLDATLTLTDGSTTVSPFVVLT